MRDFAKSKKELYDSQAMAMSADAINKLAADAGMGLDEYLAKCESKKQENEKRNKEIERHHIAKQQIEINKLKRSLTTHELIQELIKRSSNPSKMFLSMKNAPKEAVQNAKNDFLQLIEQELGV